MLQQLKDGEVDLLAGATRTPDREKFAYFTEPYRDEQFSLYIATGRLAELGEKSFEQLMEEGLRFGVVEDYLYGDPVSSFQDDPEYQERFEYSSMAYSVEKLGCEMRYFVARISMRGLCSG